MRWLIPAVGGEPVQDLSRALGVSPLLARLLVLRGLDDPATASRFLNPHLGELHDPSRMLGMDAAVRRVFQAIEQRQAILIYGDYDVDGALAVVVLRTALALAGADVHHYIPHRIHDGYGMREEVIEQARQQHFSLIISVDTGIRAFPVVERARELGIDCIITDHHLPEGFQHAAADSAAETQAGNFSSMVPQAVAVLNPKQVNCGYPDKNLCGAGVAFKLAHAVLRAHPAQSRRLAALLPSLLKLVCIGTIADNVPLVGENRVIARLGLDGLRNPVNPGLKALLETAGLSGRSVTADDVAFRLAPRINAAGRMESAQDVIDLFTRADAEAAREIAGKLNRLNSERQKAEQKILEELEVRQSEQPETFTDRLLVLEGNGWHRGVIGIVASRILDRFHRPTLVIACDGSKGHGSGRSFEAFPLLEALTSCEDLFERFGGHACAAGFVVPVDRIGELRRRLNQFAAGRLKEDLQEPQIAVDEEISFADLSPQALADLERLAPHGYGNPRPVFAARNTRLLGAPRLLKERHLKMQVAQQNHRFDAIGWRKAAMIEQVRNSTRFDLAFHLARNEYRNRTTILLELLDIASPDC